MDERTNLLGESMASAPPEAAADKAAAKDPKRIVNRWIEGDAEWGLQADGHYRILRCGDIEPQAMVRVYITGHGYVIGTVKALVPGWGPWPRPVIVVVALKPYKPDMARPKKPIPSQFRSDQVTVLQKAPPRKQVTNS
jgi:hypothetical protein